MSPTISAEPGPIITTRHGRFRISAQDTVLGARLAETQEWEPAQTALMEALLRPGDLFVDVGANLGWHSIVAANRIAPDGHVIAVEPEPLNFRLLNENLAMSFLDLVATVRNVALSDQPGTIDLELAPENLGDHRVRHVEPPAQGEHFNEQARETIQVEAITLDDLMAQARSGPRNLPDTVRLLKLDAQGSEERILAGGENTLANTEFALVECWPYALDRAGSSAGGLLEKLSAHFDRIRVVDGLALEVEDWRGREITPEQLLQQTVNMEGGAFLDLLFYHSKGEPPPDGR